MKQNRFDLEFGKQFLRIPFFTGLLLGGLQSAAASNSSCGETLNEGIKIHVGSELGFGDAALVETFVINHTSPKQNLNLNLSAKQSDTPSIRLENKGGIIGDRFVDPRRSKDVPDRVRKFKDPKYHAEIHPARILFQELASTLAPLIDDFLKSPDQENLAPEYKINFSKIMGVLSYKIPPIDIRPGTDSIFAKLPKDRVAATTINSPGATIVLNQDLINWGETSLMDLSKLRFGPSKMGELINSSIIDHDSPFTLQFSPKNEVIAAHTTKEALISWFRILIHELGHQIGLTDDATLTPDMLAAQIEAHLQKQISIYELETDNRSHPWAKVIQVLSTSHPGNNRLFALDLFGVKDLTPSVHKWISQIFPELNASQTWLADLHLKSGANWDIYNLAAPMVLSGTLFIEKPNKNSDPSLLKRDIELILFYGAESTLQDTDFNSHLWGASGKNPELIYGPENESLIQMRLLPQKIDSLRQYTLRGSTLSPTLNVSPKETWRMTLEGIEIPDELEPISAKFNIRPSELRHNVWFRQEEPIQLKGRWTSSHGKPQLHLDYKPKQALQPGSYFIEYIEGQFKHRETGKKMSIEVKSTDRLSIVVADQGQSRKRKPLVLKRFGTMMVKVVDPGDQLRWFPVHANFNLTWKSHQIPNSKTEFIAGWLPVPFVFNRPFNPNDLWLHGSAIVKTKTGEESHLLFSGPLEQLGAIVRNKRVYQNKDNETVLELELHRPLMVNNFEFVKWYFAGMTVVEDTFEVSFQRLHLYFGKTVEDAPTTDRSEK